MGGVKRLISWLIGNKKCIVWKNKKCTYPYLKSSFQTIIHNHHLDLYNYTTIATSPHYLNLYLNILSPDLSLNLLCYCNLDLDPDLVFCHDLNFPSPPLSQAPSQPLPTLMLYLFWDRDKRKDGSHKNWDTFLCLFVKKIIDGHILNTYVDQFWCIFHPPRTRGTNFPPFQWMSIPILADINLDSAVMVSPWAHNHAPLQWGRDLTAQPRGKATISPQEGWRWPRHEVSTSWSRHKVAS